MNCAIDNDGSNAKPHATSLPGLGPGRSPSRPSFRLVCIDHLHGRTAGVRQQYDGPAAAVITHTCETNVTRTRIPAFRGHWLIPVEEPGTTDLANPGGRAVRLVRGYRLARSARLRWRQQHGDHG
jgi:hypothetical protein